jgi:hypothetical protein
MSTACRGLWILVLGFGLAGFGCGDDSSPTDTGGDDGAVDEGGADADADAEAEADAAADGSAGTWTATAPMTAARGYHSLAVLPSGKVLASGINMYDSEAATPACEVYDEAAGTWTATGSMSAARALDAAIALPSGMVLAAGGFEDIFLTTQTLLDSAELFDEESGGGAWSMTGSMSEPKAEMALAVLPSGAILVTGGERLGSGNAVATVEIFDPTTATFAPADPMAQARRYHTATVLESGEVLVAGGCPVGDCATATDTAELYDPAAGTWSAAGLMPEVLTLHVATLLPDGRVFMTGGAHGEPGYVPTDGTFLYDPATDSWTVAASMQCARWGHVAKVLTSGKVLVAGGTVNSPSACALRTEIYDPATDVWTDGPSMVADHGSGLRAAPLPSGGWLIAGGIIEAGIDWSSTAAAEIYEE